jgi:hypothetical protein
MATGHMACKADNQQQATACCGLLQTTAAFQPTAQLLPLAQLPILLHN